jgi:hypothetical protein
MLSFRVILQAGAKFYLLKIVCPLETLPYAPRFLVMQAGVPIGVRPGTGLFCRIGPSVVIGYSHAEKLS